MTINENCPFQYIETIQLSVLLFSISKTQKLQQKENESERRNIERKQQKIEMNEVTEKRKRGNEIETNFILIAFQ